MSRAVNQTGTETLIPTAYTEGSGMTTNSSYPTSNGLTNSSSSNYAQFTAPNGSLGYCYYEIDTSAVPENATSITVSCTVKISVSNSSGHSSATIQLYSGNTAKGSATSFYNSTSTTARTMTTGTWTRSELSNARLRIEGQRNTTSNRYIRFYGATITVNWTVSGTEYEVTITNNSSGVTTTPSGTSYVFQGNSQSIRFDDISDLNGLVITDNGTDVKSSLVYTGPGTTTLNLYPEECESYTGSFNSSYPATNAIGSTNGTSSSSNYAQLTFSTTNISMTYNFGDIVVPSDATNISVSCSVKAMKYNSSNITATVQLYSGGTAKGSAYTLSNSTNAFNLTAGTWTASELSNLKIIFNGSYASGTSTSRYIRFYGANLTISYYIADTFYTYTINNISADHTIVIRDAQKIYMKVNGSWVTASKVYKKVSGSWVEQTDFTNLFDTNTIYITK